MFCLHFGLYRNDLNFILEYRFLCVAHILTLTDVAMPDLSKLSYRIIFFLAFDIAIHMSNQVCTWVCLHNERNEWNVNRVTIHSQHQIAEM